MEQRRPVLFFLISTAILFLWMGVVMPRFFPQPKAPVKPPVDAAATEGDLPAIAEIPGEPLEEAKIGAGGGAAEPEKKPESDKPAQGPPKFAHNGRVILGSLDPKSGYFLEVELTTEGAAINTVRLNDPRYRELDNPKEPLPLLNEMRIPAGTEARLPAGLDYYRTLQTAIDKLDEQLAPHKTSVDALDWELDAKSRTESEATFRMPSVDGSLEVVKKYSLQKRPLPAGMSEKQFRDTDSAGYQLVMEMTVRNTGAERQTVEYTLQGPVGVPLENAKNSRKFRDLRMGFLQTSGSVKSNTMTAQQIVTDEEKEDKKPEEWTTPVRYIGVDMQYFAALLVPAPDQLKDSYVSTSRPQLLKKAKEEPQSDVSVQLTSVPLDLAPGRAVTHTWTLFAGPKQEPLLVPLEAEPIVDFGFASIITRGMLWLLETFHNVGLPYWLAIICLTIVVRACMFPISRKQAIAAKKMKDLQPKVLEIKKKYGDDKEKVGRATLELYSKHNCNPLGGCVPMLLQLPIFIGLYNSINSAVDLRLQPFLYIKNLAAPDALFQLPFDIPFIHTNDFNLLPIVTVALFIVQQKLFTPPPTDEQQAANAKIMPYMMAFMGFMFYKVPAGLCLYFIASSLWGIGERKLLDFLMKKDPALIMPDDDGGGSGPKKPNAPPSSGPARENFWTKLLAQADHAAKQAQSKNRDGINGSAGSNGDGDKKDKRKSRNKR